MYDFIDEDRRVLKRLFLIAIEVLRDVNLITKEDKTEFSHVYLSDIHNLVENETSLWGDENWKKKKFLDQYSAALLTKRHVVQWGTLFFGISERYGSADPKLL